MLSPHVLSLEDIGHEVARGVMGRVLGQAQRGGRRRLEEIAYETLYTAEARFGRAGGAAPSRQEREERAFISWLRRTLAAARPDRYAEIVYRIVEHYLGEIGGHFDARVYRLATTVIPPAISFVFHGPRHGGRGLFDVADRLLIEGHADALRALVGMGTVILAPTHVSNLDSLVMGSVMHRLGLPPFAYGAGLNLFSSVPLAFLMRHLGAYTVDRKKDDPLYRWTLKEYTTTLLARGQHNLFFPGGTRSRSGLLEGEVKKGLLGTAPAAFRRALLAGSHRPRIFVVPCTLTYPLVLEAGTLIGDYLRTEGGPQDIDLRDESNLPRRWFDFVSGLRRLDQRVHVRISRPLDWLGNDVDDEGVSHDPRGRPVDPRDYLLVDGQPAEDELRDAELTRGLAARVVAAYRRDNVALPTSLVAFVLFERLRRACPEPSLFRFVRNLGPESGIRVGDVLGDVARGLEELAIHARAGRISLAGDIEGAAAPTVLGRALATFATYHARPVVDRRRGRLFVGDPGLLFYYRNRLDGYGLLGTRGPAPALPPVEEARPS